eukprot:15430408-Alexandrium_andersonii.AAC.1
MLPTTLRRLREAVTVSAVAPLIEPTLSAWQAARQGGSCRENISAVLAHLGGSAAELPADHAAAADRRQLRAGLSGPLAEAWDQAPQDGPQGR